MGFLFVTRQLWLSRRGDATHTGQPVLEYTSKRISKRIIYAVKTNEI